MSPNGLPIDLMTLADIPDIAAIEFASFPASYGPSSGQSADLSPLERGPTDEMTELQRIAAQLREELVRPWARLWVIREDGARRPLAFLIAWHVVDELHVLNVAAHPSHRRRGLGHALLEHAIDFARSKGVRQVLLEVRRSNDPAVALYRSLGFFARGLRRRYYSNDEDAVEMALLLDPVTGKIVAGSDEVRLDA
jgi:ribosomal-protein-alanine N-acetyltransferase